MSSSITPSTTPTAWDPVALYDKAQRYVEQMSEHETDDWRYALWSGLALELLARSALASVSPSLLADTSKSWSSHYHALGFTPVEEKYSPRSIAVSEVLKRLSSIIPTFTKEHESFGILHTGRRNEELHSGELAFDDVKPSSWQPRFYSCCDALLISMSKSLEDFFGSDESRVARALIAADEDKSSKSVTSDIEAHRKVWTSKNTADQERLTSQAAVWATRQDGHRVECPSCHSQALVFGDPVSAPNRKLEHDYIREIQEYLPHHFECIACGLKIHSLAGLAVAKLGDRYKRTQTYDPAEYYSPSDPYAGYEEDNNEP